ncbi:MAG: DUF3179 domain-containing protein [Winogradskyella sp.]|uniref:DUF3179 domain-containing protein n=1 Tax=Winogradskyella sp. TaxID=1883156 RepID=UPI0017D2A37C|nr:DUF3179 domain-containing protein [Winogradskyella sp.]
MKTLKNILLIILYTTLYTCSSNDSPNSNGDSNSNGVNGNTNPNTSWLIPVNEVVDGGPGKDGIPSIDNPNFESANSVSFLSNDELVIGVKIGNVIKAYPHYVLDWHEIVNDSFNTTNSTISYCPLTGTAFAWNSMAGNTFSTFGVSGLLYNANLILYDRETDSNWSQILQKCVNGELIGSEPQKISVIETNWETWKNSFPNSQVLTTQTGFSKPYGTYPYGPYKTDHDFFIFNPSILNNALPNKERVYAIFNNDQSKVYRFSQFNGGSAIRDTFFNSEYLIVGNDNLIVAFKINAAIANLDFSYSYNGSEEFFTDSENNKWNMFGEAIEGPRLGQTLNKAESVTSMWFAIATFFPNPTIYLD